MPGVWHEPEPNLSPACVGEDLVITSQRRDTSAEALMMKLIVSSRKCPNVGDTNKITLIICFYTFQLTKLKYREPLAVYSSLLQETVINFRFFFSVVNMPMYEIYYNYFFPQRKT